MVKRHETILINKDGEKSPADIYIEQRQGDTIIKTVFKRNRITTRQKRYILVKEDGTSEVVPLDESVANEIVDRICQTGSYSSSFIIKKIQDNGNGNGHAESVVLKHRLTEEEKNFTSTGDKFYRHLDRLQQFQKTGRTNPVSCHISPEGKCNLKCAYCSVTNRNIIARIDFPVIEKWLDVLTRRGLKAVILTGGGEPTLYPEFNRLVRLIRSHDLEVALITNGTNFHLIDEALLGEFTWIRVSINIFPDWEKRIAIPKDLHEKTVLGFSYVYSTETDEETFRKISDFVDRHHGQYVRLLPNCLLNQEELILQHQALAKILEKINNPKFFHQLKLHEAPSRFFKRCPMGYFRPYLSEEINRHGYPGTVYSCDSVVLNNESMQFDPKYAICSAHEIEDYLDGKIEPQFVPHEDCKGCVFTRNLRVLENIAKPAMHENFI